MAFFDPTKLYTKMPAAPPQVVPPVPPPAAPTPKPPVNAFGIAQKAIALASGGVGSVIAQAASPKNLSTLATMGKNVLETLAPESMKAAETAKTPLESVAAGANIPKEAIVQPALRLGTQLVRQLKYRGADPGFTPETGVEQALLGKEPVRPLPEQLAELPKTGYEVAGKLPGVGKEGTFSGTVPRVFGALLGAGVAGTSEAVSVDPMLGGEKAGVKAAEELTGRVAEKSAAEKLVEAGTKALEEKALPFKNVATEVKSTFLPARMSAEAQAAADMLREAKATIENAKTIEMTRGEKDLKFFEKGKGIAGIPSRVSTPEADIANISNYERTGKFSRAPDGYSEFYKKSTDAAHAVLNQVYKDDPVGYVDNYIRRQYKFATPDDEAKGAQVLYDRTRSLSASKSPTRERILKVPLDEALQAMREKGIKVEPVTTNPEMLRRWTVNNANQAQTYARVWSDAKKSGLVSFVGSGKNPPQGFVKLADPVAEKFFPAEAGMVKAGAYYADPNVARVFNNAISSGLSASPTATGLRAMTNTMNQFQLGFSGFHFAGTAINAGLTDIARGIEDILSGKTISGGKKIALGATPLASFGRDMFMGNKLMKELEKSSPEAYAVLKERINPGGMRLQMDANYRNEAFQRMTDAFRKNNILEGAVQIPASIIEAVTKPLMEFAIPRVKVGAYMELASDTLSRLPPDATDAVKKRALSEVADSIDNRFGQLAYDNLFWDRRVKDAMMMGTRSLGWNLGTVRELGGAITDIPGALKNKKMTSRQAYAIALPMYVGLLGSVYQFLHTGKAPESSLDALAPQNGLKDANGDSARVMLPTYMKDVVAYSKNPIQTLENKSSPGMSFMFALMNNKDYYGDMIRNPNDPAAKQLEQVGKYALSQFVPFSISQAQKSAQESGGTEQQAESFFGVVKAPKDITQTRAEAFMESKMRAKAPRTPEQVDIANLKATARTEIKQGKVDALKQLIANGILKDEKSINAFVQAAKLTPRQAQVKMLGKASGDRAEYIKMKLDELKTPDEKLAFLKQMRDAKVLTADVLKLL